MKTLSKHFRRAALLAAGLMTLAPAAAFAGTWRLNADRCPELRQDYRDMHDRGRRGWDDDRRYDDRRYDDRRYDDRRYDDRRRDESRVVVCPARAWTYYPSRGERRWDRNAYPRQVILYRDGRVFQRDYRGQMVNLGVTIRLG